MKKYVIAEIDGHKLNNITDMLKDYTVLHERIKSLYKMLEIHRYIYWYWYDSARINKKNYWKNYHDILKNTINIRSLGLILEYKEDMENISIRNNKIRDIKHEIKRYHRMQSNIQNVISDMCVGGGIKLIYKKYNSEKVPSQFKNSMNYTYAYMQL